jgi:hypothetical protein
MKHLAIIAWIGAALFLTLPALHAQAPAITSVCPSPLVGPTTQGTAYTGTVLISGQNLQGADITTDGPLFLTGSSTVNSAGTRISRGFSIGSGAQNGQQFHFFVGSESTGSASILDTISLSPTPPDPTCPGAVTQSGALLEINGSVSEQTIDLFVTDRTIHSLLSGSTKPTSPCDGLPSDSYVLQGGSPTGCDNGSPFETTQKPGHFTFSSSSGLYKFDVSTVYRSGCNTAGNICGTNEGPTGLLTVTNTGTSAFFGTITLSGTSPICGSVSDSFTGTLFAPGGDSNGSSSVTLALRSGGDTNNSDSSECGGFQSETTSGDIVPVAPGRTTTLLSDGPLTQSITLPQGTTMNCLGSPAVASMRDVLTLVDPSTFDPSVEFGNAGDPAFFGGSAIPGPPAANPHCLKVTSTKCAIILNQCFDSSGNQFPDCMCITPPQNTLIGLDSLHSNSVDPKNPAYVIAHDTDVPLVTVPLGGPNSGQPFPDWTNITQRFHPGCTTPPCGTGGGGLHLNGRESVIDLNLSCEVVSFGISPSTVIAGSPITLTGTVQGCGSSTNGLLTFTFEGPLNFGKGCTQTALSIPKPPPPGGTQTGFPVTLPATPKTFGPTTLFVPFNACPGNFTFSTTIKSGNIIYNNSVPLTVNPHM